MGYNHEKIIQAIQRSSKKSFIRKLFSRNTHIRQIDIYHLKDNTLNKYVSMIPFYNPNKQKKEDVVNQILEVMRGEPTKKELLILEAKFLGKNSPIKNIGSNKSDTSDIFIPSPDNRINSVYHLIISKLYPLMSKREKNIYMSKFYDVYYYDFNEYIKRNIAKGAELVEVTDIFDEFATKINKKKKNIDIETFVSSKNLQKDDFFKNNKDYEKWLKKIKKEKGIKNLYSYKSVNLNFVSKTSKLVGFDKSEIKKIIEKENKKSIKNTFGVNVEDKHGDNVNTPFLNYLYVLENIENEVTRTKRAAEQCKSLLVKFQEYKTMISNAGTMKKRNHILSIMKRKVSEYDTEVSALLGVESLFGIEHSKNKKKTMVSLLLKNNVKLGEGFLGNDIGLIRGKTNELVCLYDECLQQTNDLNDGELVKSKSKKETLDRNSKKQLHEEVNTSQKFNYMTLEKKPEEE